MIMKGLIILCGLVCIMLAVIGMMTGCSTSSSASAVPSSVLTPPSSQYLADIIGRVTVISNNVVLGGSALPNVTPGIKYWVTQIFIRNKGYQSVQIGLTGAPWLIRTSVVQPPQDVGGVPGRIVAPSVTITQGQEGQVLFVFGVWPPNPYSSNPVIPNPNNSQIRFMGLVSQGSTNLQVDSFGSLVYTGAVAESYDWDSQSVVQATIHASPSPTRSVSPIPFGTYVSSTQFGTASITLNSDGTYVMTGGLFGKDVGTYVLSLNQITLHSANPSLGQYTQLYSYSDQFKCLYMGLSSSAMIPYYRQ